MPQAIADQLLLIVTLSMLVSPILFIVYQHLIAPRYVEQSPSKEETFPEQANIIIAGSGRVGGLVDRILKIGGFKATVIDHNYQRLEIMARLGVRYFFGDATRPDLLSAAGIDKAKLLIIALDDKEQISKLTQHVVQTYPHVHILARGVDRHHVYDLWSLGCRDIIRETYDSSLRMGRAAYEALGLDRERAELIVELFNNYDAKMMQVAADAYDPKTPFEDNDEYVKLVQDYMQQYAPKLKETVAAIKSGTLSVERIRNQLDDNTLGNN